MTFRTLFVSLAVGSLFVSNVVMAAEQKIVFVVDYFKLRGSKTTAEKCERSCSVKFNTGKLEPLTSTGWKIVSSTSKEAICVDDWAVAPGYPLTLGCSGIGTQYVLQKDDPILEPKAEVPNKEVELLKKETELLKQEIALLKQENENLKAQLKPKQKKK